MSKHSKWFRITVYISWCEGKGLGRELIMSYCSLQGTSNKLIVILFLLQDSSKIHKDELKLQGLRPKPHEGAVLCWSGLFISVRWGFGNKMGDQ
jgi:hypothetical protein